ncbi:MAG: hypothetical protein ACKON7_07925 [Planctomycetaceae bacterium]
MPQHLILVAQLSASAFMAGVIWLVQLAHYPLFDGVEGGRSTDAFRANQRRTAAVVMPPMLVEGITAALVALAPPPGVGRPAALAGLALVGLLWLSTALVQMPLHERLGRDGHEPATIARLVRGNWVRTIAWTARAVLAAWMLHAAT